MPVTRHSLRQGRNTSSTPYLIDGNETNTTTGSSSTTSSTVHWRRQWIVPNSSSGPLPGSINSSNTVQTNGSVTPSISKEETANTSDSNGHVPMGADAILPHLNFKIKMWVPVDLSGDIIDDPIVQGDEDDLLDFGILSQGTAGKKAEASNTNDLTAADIRGAVGGEAIPGIISSGYNEAESKNDGATEGSSASVSASTTVPITTTVTTEVEQPVVTMVDGKIKQSEESAEAKTQDSPVNSLRDTHISEKQQQPQQLESAPLQASINQSLMDVDEKEKGIEQPAVSDLSQSVIPVQSDPELTQVPKLGNTVTKELTTTAPEESVQSETQPQKSEPTILLETKPSLKNESSSNLSLEQSQNSPDLSNQIQAKPTDADGDTTMDTS
ncbi:hypothetical protein NADFUDRAFT_82461 [Nadsonia fulvescens var. elongata DSM 6958]|uniref:Uncharacterized protein n=1 Tax=Nadsonia fulvescens var. elongata DSM 6958 TaxID=857566 RepID=A0A1E3PPF2_9ASCO|nr:hypothetical protein NADFUDRAFT_82461 [Nadsonia fulvescens var. elongata DSM 6958]